jgi:tetratricopeptide (TPR) repeat protein
MARTLEFAVLVLCLATAPGDPGVVRPSGAAPAPTHAAAPRSASTGAQDGGRDNAHDGAPSDERATRAHDAWSLAGALADAHARGDAAAVSACAATLAEVGARRPDDASVAVCAAAAARLRADLAADPAGGAAAARQRDDAFTSTMLDVAAVALDAARFEIASRYVELAHLGTASEPTLALQRTVIDGKVGEALGDFERAARGAGELLALLAAGLDDELHAITHANAANLFFACGDFEAAVASWDAALAAGRDDYGAPLLALPDRCNYWRLCEDHAAHLADAEAFLDALDAYALPEGDSRRFVAHYQRACALHRLGDLDAAEAAFERARDIARALPDQEAKAAAAEDGLALVALARGEFARARQHLDAALEVERRLGHEQFLLDTLQTAALVGLRTGDLAGVRAACDEAAALLEHDGLRALGAAEASALRSRYAAWSRLEQELVSASVAAGDEARAGADADLAASRHSTLVAGLRAALRWSGRSVVEARGLAPSENGAALVAELRAALGPHDALVHYVEREAGLAAYVLSADTLAWVELGALAEARALVERFHREVLVAATRRGPAEVAELAHALHERVLAPALRALPREPRGLVVVACDALATLPFDALVVEPATRTPERFEDLPFAVRRWRIAALPSALLLVDLRTAPRRPQRSGRVCLIGDPSFAPFRGRQPAELPYTRHELLGAALARFEARAEARAEDEARDARANEARRAFDERVVGHQGAIAFDDGTGLELYLGSAATPERITDLDGPVDVLQAATHTCPSTAEPWSVGLLLAPGADGDAVLDLADIRALRCRPELVVLSACSSGTGPVVRGDGVQSLAAAFFALGTRDVVASIAPVDDAEACHFSNAFHAELARGRAPADALRAAKLAHLAAPTDTHADAHIDAPIAPQAPSAAPTTSAPRLGLGTLEAANSAPLPRGHPRRWATFVHWGG